MSANSRVLAVAAALLAGCLAPLAPFAAPAEPPAGPPGERAAVASFPLPVTCSPERPTIAPGETIRVTAWAMSPRGLRPAYTWTATGGRLDGEGSAIRWSFRAVVPGPQTATVRIEGLNGGYADCSVRVFVRPPHERRLPRETGRSFLAQGQTEAEGYGLYSYLLLGSPARDAARERQRKAVEAFWGLIPEIASLQRYIPPRDLNVAYLPIVGPPGPAVTAEWAFEHYDYARSRALLRAIPGSHREGPYIVSSLGPLSATTRLSGQYLYQDLSAIPPHLVESWVKEFLNQAAQERFWKADTAERLALKMRTTIGILALGLPDVREGLETWIAWIR